MIPKISDQLFAKLESDRASGLHRIVKNEIFCKCGVICHGLREWELHAHGKEMVDVMDKLITEIKEMRPKK